MTIAPQPKGTLEQKTQAFIDGAGKSRKGKGRALFIRVNEELGERIDQAAQRRGLKPNAFVLSTIMEKLEQEEG